MPPMALGSRSTVPPKFTSPWVMDVEHANGRLVVAQKGGALDDSCAIRSVEPDGTSITYRETMGERPSNFRCGTPVLGVHGTAGARASIFYSDRTYAPRSPISTYRRVWIDVPIDHDELVYRLFATTPTGYAGLLPVVGPVDLNSIPSRDRFRPKRSARRTVAVSSRCSRGRQPGSSSPRSGFRLSRRAFAGWTPASLRFIGEWQAPTLDDTGGPQRSATRDPCRRIRA